LEASRDWQSQKRDGVITAVRAAIAKLEKQGAAINFRSVSQISGVSRKTLYAASEAKALIASCRSGGETDLFAKVAELEAENKRLKEILRAVRVRIRSLELDS
jgi:hypothetical protein